MMQSFLEDLETRLDPATEEELYRQWHEFVDGEFSGDIFSPRRRCTTRPSIEWPTVRINEALEDFNKMLLQQFGGCSRMLEGGGGGLLCVRANYGSSILPSLFGVKLFIMDDQFNTLPTTEPLSGGADAVRALLDRGVPDLNTGFGARTLEVGRRFMELMAPYPKLSEYVCVYHPDTQGPMDICEVLWGSALFLDIMDMPDLVKDFLALITDTSIAFLHKWQEAVPFSGDSEVHWSMLHKGHVMLRDDSAMNFSPEMFDEFIAPYNQRILDEFGGGAGHFCGRGEHFIDRLCALRGFHGVAMSQPEYNDMETIFRHTVDRDIPLLGLARSAAEKALARGRDLHGNVHCS